MIAIRKSDSEIFRNISFGDYSCTKDDLFVFDQELRLVKYVSNRNDADVYYSESEVQQRIEAAVEEHNKSQESPLQKVSIELANQHEQNELLRGEIKQWKWKCDGLEEENKQWHARIAELRAERQPVEVSAELAGAIEWFKSVHSSGWESVFLTSKPHDCLPLKLHNDKYYEEYFHYGEFELLEIVKRGYTVKPDPLRIRIAAILGNDHEQLDEVVAAAREDGKNE